MSGYTQKPPPELQWAWWYPPERLMAHLLWIAMQAASTDPWVALSIGFRTLNLRKKAGKKNKGTSRYLQMHRL